MGGAMTWRELYELLDRTHRAYKRAMRGYRGRHKQG